MAPCSSTLHLTAAQREAAAATMAAARLTGCPALVLALTRTCDVHVILLTTSRGALHPASAQEGATAVAAFAALLVSQPPAVLALMVIGVAAVIMGTRCLAPASAAMGARAALARAARWMVLATGVAAADEAGSANVAMTTGERASSILGWGRMPITDQSKSRVLTADLLGKMPADLTMLGGAEIQAVITTAGPGRKRTTPVVARATTVAGATLTGTLGAVTAAAGTEGVAPIVPVPVTEGATATRTWTPANMPTGEARIASKGVTVLGGTIGAEVRASTTLSMGAEAAHAATTAAGGTAAGIHTTPLAAISTGVGVSTTEILALVIVSTEAESVVETAAVAWTAITTATMVGVTPSATTAATGMGGATGMVVVAVRGTTVEAMTASAQATAATVATASEGGGDDRSQLPVSLSTRATAKAWRLMTRLERWLRRWGSVRGSLGHDRADTCAHWIQGRLDTTKIPGMQPCLAAEAEPATRARRLTHGC